MRRFLKNGAQTVSSNKSDAQIIAEVDELHRKYAGYLYTLCFRMMRDRGEAEDMLQETFIRVFRFYGSFTQGDNYLPWLSRIATNTCLNGLKKRKTNRAVLVEEPGSVAVAEDAGRPDMNTHLQHQQLVQLILNNEDERGQQILVLHFVAGMTLEEVASSLKISKRAVVKRLTKFRAKITQSTLSSEEDHV